MDWGKGDEGRLCWLGGGGGGGVTPQEFPNAVLCLLPNHVPAAMHARR